ncbi:MAG: dTDP-4-amino-4,6-dideoxyglucose formyltransferase [Gammaproteobacteria bacterium]|nr:dTDP-4-amino-4,6-dideoxyglucose formyltransferase [Gammaproteobacteria bacterium]
MNTLIITDNVFALSLTNELNDLYGNIEVRQSPNGLLPDTPSINVVKDTNEIIKNYDLVISIHCKQFFPTELIKNVRCINIHPGYNPCNRGWYPQVFSILNGMTAGVTIHEIDNQLDHGKIIIQKEYKIESWDTSGSAYAKIMKLERELVLENFVSILNNNYIAIAPESEGNVNYKKDFDELNYINLKENGTFGDFLNRLRAMTHDDFRNAYFIDDSGKKVFIRIHLEAENIEQTPY